MRLLALDYGAARCGCALSDPTATLARPIDVLEPPEAAAVSALVDEHGVEKVIVGLPVTMGGEEGAQAEASRSFAAELEELLAVPVETYDERLTTKLAERSAREGAAAAEDSLAAAHLLESYIAAHA